MPVDTPLEVIILAAGKGTRMRSSLPKVLHPLAGKPMLLHVLQTAAWLKPKKIHVVVGHGSDQVQAAVDQSGLSASINWVEQKQQNGTGHAVAQAMPSVAKNAVVLVMAGDVPLIQADTLKDLTKVETGIHLLTIDLPQPHGFGRIIRQDDGHVCAIVEEKDASEAQRAISEINTGLMAMPAAQLKDWLSHLDNNNAQGEYYLTDVIALAHADKQVVTAVVTDKQDEVTGINSRAELAQLERAYQLQLAHHYMAQGVSFADPARVDFRGDCAFGQDVHVDVNVVFAGEVRIGADVHIGPNTVITDSVIEDGCVVEANCVIEKAVLNHNCTVGPFARLRPETVLQQGARIGNFVEIKKSTIGVGSKVNHLSYVGDSEVGENVNIGAGVITCNYDGANKHQTIIGDNVFVGSDCQLVAPVTIATGATIGAGSTIVKDVKAGQLALSRSAQRAIEGWQRPSKRTKK